MQYVQSINIQRKMMIMCGRYFIDSDMADKIEKVVHDIDQRVGRNVLQEISFQTMYTDH